jgi:hypothetical protein
MMAATVVLGVQRVFMGAIMSAMGTLSGNKGDGRGKYQSLLIFERGSGSARGHAGARPRGKTDFG